MTLVQVFNRRSNIYTEAVTRLENDGIAFGLVLGVGDDNLPSRRALLPLLRDAYFHSIDM
jgi:hypothetical protein